MFLWCSTVDRDLHGCQAACRR